MTIPDHYATPTAFRRALETRLKSIAMQEETDLQRLRRQVTFDRFLCRLFQQQPDAWVLKGGYAMELRIKSARTTKDIDLAFRQAFERGGSGRSAGMLLERLQQAAAVDLGDGFSFLVGEAMMDLETAPYGGARYPIEARMDGRTFVKFHLDAGIGDIVIEPIEVVAPRDWLNFLGIPPVSFPVLPAEQQFAEKYHAYTFVRGDRPNSRVRDLVDMLLLIRHSELEIARVGHSLRATFTRRGTHPVPETVPTPPAFWSVQFTSMAASCRIEIALDEAVKELKMFLVNNIKSS